MSEDALPENDPIRVRDSGGFIDLLRRLGCSLAISTRPNDLVMLGAGEGDALLSQCNFFRFYRPMGLACDGNRIAIATLNELFVFANVPEIAADLPDDPGRYDAVFVPRTMHFTGNCDLHDMVFHGAAVVAVNTRYSCVCMIDGQYNFTPLWRPPFITELTPEDRCHLNGMAFRDGRVRFVTMLGVSDQPGGWRDGMAEGGVLMEVPSGRVVTSSLSMPHSPRLIGERLYVLEGGRGRLLGIDRVTGDQFVLAQLPGFVHGLAEHNGVLFVGISKLRNKRGPRSLPIEADADKLIAGVAAIDAGSGAILGMVEFLNAVEEVYDVHVLPGITRPGVRDPVKWYEAMSIVTPNGGFWLPRREPAESEN